MRTQNILSAWLVGACLVLAPTAGAYVTPGSLRAFTFDPIYYQANSTEILTPAITALQHNRYSYVSYVQRTNPPGPGEDGLLFLQNELSGSTHGGIAYGAAAIATWGDQDAPYYQYPNGDLAVEWYDNSGIAQTILDAYVNAHQTTYTYAEVVIIVRDPNQPPDYVIAATPSGITYYSNAANAAVFLGAGHGTHSAGSFDARIVATPPEVFGDSDATATASACQQFWDHLDGQYGSSLRDVFTAAGTAGLTTVVPLGFDNYVRLSPSITSVSPAQNFLITGPTTVVINFDTKMQTVTSPSQFLSVPAGNTFTITNARWLTGSTSDAAAVDLQPQKNGKGFVTLNALFCKSLGGIPTNPSGVGTAAASYQLNYQISVNSAAALTSLNAMNTGGGNRVSFSSEWEANTRAFQVQGLDASGSPLFTLPEVAAQGAGGRYSYEVWDPTGALGQAYRLIEHQSDSLPDLTYGTCEAMEPFTLAAQESLYYDTGALSDSLDMLGNPGSAITSGATPGEYILVCPDSFVVALGAYANIWRSRGHTVDIVPLSVASTQGGVAGYIQWASAQGTRYALLVGDANDAEWWDDQSKWVNGWNWPRRASDGTHIPSQAGRNLIPTFYTADPDSPRITMSGYTPYFASDLPYADVDSDGLPDVMIGRLPAGSVGDVNAYTYKLGTYLGYNRGLSWQNAYELTFAQDHGQVLGSAIAPDADTLALSFPGSVTLTRYTDVGWTEAHKESLANSAANSGTDLIAWMSTGSHRYFYANFWRLDQGWSMAKLTPPALTGNFFVSLGLSCDLGNFDETEDYANLASFSNPIRPVSERLLFDPGKGAIACIGPTRGSFESGNLVFGKEFLRHLYSGGKNLGTAFLLAQRNAIVHDPGMANLYRSYEFLGDPLIGPSLVTGVSGTTNAPSIRFEAARPNPFNPSTIITISLNAPMVVRLGIYDVSGRLVRFLLNGKRMPSGRTQVRWDGRSATGSSSSGVYFARLEAGKTSLMQKLVLLK
jgi:hypothetical protein